MRGRSWRRRGRRTMCTHGREAVWEGHGKEARPCEMVRRHSSVKLPSSRMGMASWDTLARRLERRLEACFRDVSAFLPSQICFASLLEMP